jgi:hypothetical protein
VKNLFVFAGVIFSQQMLTPLAWTALGAFVIFCGLSGAIYLFNDVVDAERDRRHPSKRLRPIASGALSRSTALVFGVLLLAGCLAAAFWISPSFGLVALGYSALLTAYSVWLKHMVILDVLTVAAGFVLRAVAVAVAVEAEISGWLLICTILMALFLGLGKRRHSTCRSRVTPRLTGRSWRTTARIPRPDDLGRHGSRDDVRALHHVARDRRQVPHAPSATDPALRALRHLPLPHLLYRRDLGNPSDLVVSDRGLLLDVLLWMLTTLAIIYGPKWPG